MASHIYAEDGGYNMISHPFADGGGPFAEDSGPHKGDAYIGLPLFSALERVMAQVEFHCFMDLQRNSIDPLYKELCFIMADVLAMDNSGSVKINGSLIPIRLVKDVYAMLRHDHVRLVFDNFHMVSYRVHNKKAYLRTALYNSFFEIESHYVNAFSGHGF